MNLHFKNTDRYSGNRKHIHLTTDGLKLRNNSTKYVWRVTEADKGRVRRTFHVK